MIYETCDTIKEPDILRHGPSRDRADSHFTQCSAEVSFNVDVMHTEATPLYAMHQH